MNHDNYCLDIVFSPRPGVAFYNTRDVRQYYYDDYRDDKTDFSFFLLNKTRR